MGWSAIGSSVYRAQHRVVYRGGVQGVTGCARSVYEGVYGVCACCVWGVHKALSRGYKREGEHSPLKPPFGEPELWVKGSVNEWGCGGKVLYRILSSRSRALDPELKISSSRS